MKADIHPEYVTCTVSCVCGNSFETLSTSSVDLCSSWKRSQSTTSSKRLPSSSAFLNTQGAKILFQGESEAVYQCRACSVQLVSGSIPSTSTMICIE